MSKHIFLKINGANNMKKLLLILFLTQSAFASDLQVHLLGATYGSDLKQSKALTSPELGFTYGRNNLTYTFLGLPIERNAISFVNGIGYREKISESFFVGAMGSIMFKHYDRPEYYREKDSFELEHIVPFSYGVYFLPWLTVEKRLFINDDLSISFNGYFNHLAVHASLGVTFTFGE